MTLRSLGLRVAFIAAACAIGASAVASIGQQNFEGHKSSLRASLTMADGSTRNVTLQGVGCAASVCSRVKARDINLDTIWLDGLTAVRGISRNTVGPVLATFAFKDGSQRRASILAVNRVVYVTNRLGRTEKVDLGSLSGIEIAP